MNTEKNNKLLLAVVSGDDSDMLVRELNTHGFYVTILNSVGGFLKKRSVTIMVGLEEAKLPEALDIIERLAGRRVEQSYQNSALLREPSGEMSLPIPLPVPCGGATVFILDMDRMQRY